MTFLRTPSNISVQTNDKRTLHRSIFEALFYIAGSTMMVITIIVVAAIVSWIIYLLGNILIFHWRSIF